MSDEDGRRGSVAAPTPRDVPAFLPYAAAHLQAPFTVRVVRQADEDYQSPIEKAAKKSGSTTGRSKAALGGMSRAVLPGDADVSQSPRGSDGDDDEYALRVTALYDAYGRLVELALRRARAPCLLLKLLALCAPHQPHLTRLSLRAVALDAPALHELAALLPASQLDQLCLDDSPPRVDGYHLLLEPASRLRRLSLDRCQLGDRGAAALAAALHHPLPASRTLRSLSLASNGIGDDGARALADALRSNRRLQHLNLADNRVTDAGAVAILETLAEFPLTREESLSARRRLVARLQLRREVYARVRGALLAAATERAADLAARRRTRKSLAVELVPGGEALDARAEVVAEELLGPFDEPFGAEDTATRAGVRHCRGNGTLCWLNVAYNSLGQGALRALTAALSAQAAARRAGLLRVLLEGNALPGCCTELRAAAARLDAVLDLAQPVKKVLVAAKPKK